MGLSCDVLSSGGVFGDVFCSGVCLPKVGADVTIACVHGYTTDLDLASVASRSDRGSVIGVFADASRVTEDSLRTPCK